MRSPKELAEYTIDVGISKVNKKNIKVFLSAIFGGLFVGLGYYAYLILNSSSTAYPMMAELYRFLGAIAFTVGIIMILIGGNDLFTGNCLIFLGVFDKKIKVGKAFLNLLLVFLGNFVGAIILVTIIYFAKPSESIIEYANKLAKTKVSLGFTTSLARAIICNILVAMGVYISYAAKEVTGKIVAVFFPIFVFVITGFEHSVANMFILPLSFINGSITFMDFINNLIPVTIGNFIGGGLIVPIVYYFLYIKDKK